MTVGRVGNPSRYHSVPGPFPSAGRLSITLNTDHDKAIFAGFPSKSEREPAVGEGVVASADTGGGSRTHAGLPPEDFKSSASAVGVTLG